MSAFNSYVICYKKNVVSNDVIKAFTDHVREVLTCIKCVSLDIDVFCMHVTRPINGSNPWLCFITNKLSLLLLLCCLNDE
jgi:hypothetical protein